MSKKIFVNILVISGTFGLFLFAYREFLGTGMLSYGDSPPFPETANQAFDAFKSAWQPLSRGVILPPTLITFMEGITLLVIGGSSVLAQKIFYLATLPLAFFAMYFFLSKLVTSINARLIASFAYSVNPVTIGTFIGGAHMALYGLLFPPIISAFLIDIGNGRNLLRKTIILTLLVALSISFNFIITLFCALPFAIYVIINPLFNRNTRGFITTIVLLFTSLILSLLLTLPYSFFAYFIATQFLPGHLPTEAVLDILISNIRYCYSSSNMINIMKFGSTTLNSLQYLGSAPWTLLGLVYPILAYASLLFRNNKRNSMIKVMLTLYSFVPITLIWLAYLGPGLQIYLRFPMLFAFSNPSGLTMVLAFTYAPLMALTMDKLEVFSRRLIARDKLPQQHGVNAVGSFHKLALVNALLIIIIISSIGIYNYPFFTGDMAFSLAGRPIDQSIIPPVIYEATGWLNAHRAQGEDFRTLWVPLDYETQLNMRWLDPGSLTIPLGAGQYVDLPTAQYAGYVFYVLANDKTDRVGALFAPLNVKYIIINLISPQTGPPRATGFLDYNEPFLYGSPLDYVKILNTQKDLVFVGNQTDFLIYQNLEYLPAITVYTDSFYIVPMKNITVKPTIDFSLMKALSELPGFKPSNQALIFGDELSQDSRMSFLEKSTVIIIPASDADQLSGEYNQIKEAQAIIGFYAMNLSQGTASLFTPRGGLYRLMIRAIGDGIVSFSINGGQVNATKIGDGWWESEPVHLSAGTYRIAIHSNDRIDFYDYLVAYRTPSNSTLEEFLNNSVMTTNYKFRKISETEYSVRAKLRGPTFIYLGEMYYQGWNAYLEDREKLVHFVGNNLGNGFYINKTGEANIKIEYDIQNVKNATIYISAISWLVLFIGLTYGFKSRLKGLKRKFLST